MSDDGVSVDIDVLTRLDHLPSRFDDERLLAEGRFAARRRRSPRAQPALRRFGHEATVRPSIAFYNTRDELEQLARSVAKLADTRGRRR